MLPRCDIWAFGLLAFEVLVDGDLYKHHLQGEFCFDPTLIHDNPQLYCRELQDSAAAICSSVDDAVTRLFLQGLFRLTLLFKPHARTPRLSATLPPQYAPLKLPEKLEWSFEVKSHQGVKVYLPITNNCTVQIFDPLQSTKRSWQEQERMFRGFIEFYKRTQQDPQLSAPAAFQVALCYQMGFGVIMNQKLAHVHFNIAQRSRYAPAMILNPVLQDLSGWENHRALFTAAVIRGSNLVAYSHHIPLTVSRGNHHHDFMSYVSFKNEILSYERDDTKSSIRCQDWNRKTKSSAPIPMNHPQRCPLELDIILHDGNEQTLTLIECAVVFRDLAMLEAINKWWASKETLNIDRRYQRLGSILVQGCRTCNIRIVEILLDMGASPTIESSDGSTILHWIWLLGPETKRLLHRYMTPQRIRNIVNLVCDKPYSIHGHWPFQLSGTPMAFAIWAGSADAVATLLSLGADPLAPPFATSRKTFRGLHWSHLHLAAMLHDAKILSLLCSSLSPPMNAVRPTRSDIPTHLIACALCYSTRFERESRHGKFADLALKKTLDLLNELDETLGPPEHGAKSSGRYSEALKIAIEQNDIDVVKALLRRWPSLTVAATHGLLFRASAVSPNATHASSPLSNVTAA